MTSDADAARSWDRRPAHFLVPLLVGGAMVYAGLLALLIASRTTRSASCLPVSSATGGRFYPWQLQESGDHLGWGG